MGKNSNNARTTVVTNAYAFVPDDEEEEELVDIPVTASAVEMQPVDLRKPGALNCYHNCVSKDYEHIPEARGLTWTDEFFEDDDEGSIVAVFDLDYDLMEAYYSSLGWTCFGASVFFPNLFAFLLLGGYPCFLNKNVTWNTRSQHVAVTRDGIRFVHARRPTCWGMPCTDAGKRSKTIPFDKITDCDIVEPAGNTCLCVPNTLYSVHVDTASSNGDAGRHELTISGLKDPYSFKKLVWAMKRTGQQRAAAAVASIPAAVGMLESSRATTAAGAGTATEEDVATLLREIRDELRVHNEALVASRPPASAPPAAAPAPPREEVA